MITNLEALLTIIVYLLGGTFVLFVYSAYEKTKQKTLLLLALGMFIMVFGSNLDRLANVLITNFEPLAEVISIEEVRTLALLIEVPGILIMLYSALKS